MRGGKQSGLKPEHDTGCDCFPGRNDSSHVERRVGRDYEDLDGPAEVKTLKAGAVHLRYDVAASGRT